MTEKTYTFMEAFDLCEERGWEFFRPELDAKMFRNEDGDVWMRDRTGARGLWPYEIRAADWRRVEEPKRLHFSKVRARQIVEGDPGGLVAAWAKDWLTLHEIAEKAREALPYIGVASVSGGEVEASLQELLKVLPADGER